MSPKLVLGLYDAAPFIAFLVEMAYGILCWRIYRGGRGLLVFIVLGNLANVSFLSATIPGPEFLFGGRALLVVSVIAVQIVVTLALTGVLSRRPSSESPKAASAWHWGELPSIGRIDS